MFDIDTHFRIFRMKKCIDVNMDGGWRPHISIEMFTKWTGIEERKGIQVDRIRLPPSDFLVLFQITLFSIFFPFRTSFRSSLGSGHLSFTRRPSSCPHTQKEHQKHQRFTLFLFHSPFHFLLSTQFTLFLLSVSSFIEMDPLNRKKKLSERIPSLLSFSLHFLTWFQTIDCEARSSSSFFFCTRESLSLPFLIPSSFPSCNLRVLFSIIWKYHSMQFSLLTSTVAVKNIHLVTEESRWKSRRKFEIPFSRTYNFHSKFCSRSHQNHVCVKEPWQVCWMFCIFQLSVCIKHTLLDACMHPGKSIFRHLFSYFSSSFGGVDDGLRRKDRITSLHHDPKLEMMILIPFPCLCLVDTLCIFPLLSCTSLSNDSIKNSFPCVSLFLFSHSSRFIILPNIFSFSLSHPSTMSCFDLTGDSSDSASHSPCKANAWRQKHVRFIGPSLLFWLHLFSCWLSTMNTSSYLPASNIYSWSTLFFVHVQDHPCPSHSLVSNGTHLVVGRQEKEEEEEKEME